MADKRKLREETERLVKEAMVRRGVTIERHDTRIDLVCGKCGYHGHRLVPPDSERVSFTCKECGHTQNTI
jgi:hypothetical protein